MGVMDIRNFESFEDLAFEVVEKMQCVEDGIDIIALYDDAREIIRELILTGACTVGSMELHDPEWSGYDKEFYITVSKVIDDEWTIWCEPAMRENETEYIYGEADICYLLDNCSSRIIPRIKNSVLYETSIVDEDGVERICMYPECQKERMMQSGIEDDMDGITYTSTDENGYYSISFYSNNQDCMKDMFEAIKKIRN